MRPKRAAPFIFRCREAGDSVGPCLRRPNLFPCVGKDWGEKDAIDSKTAITCLLKNGPTFIDRPFCLSMNDCRKSPSLFVMAVSVQRKFVMCACGRREPKCRLGLHFGKEETRSENKRLRSRRLVSSRSLLTRIGPYRYVRHSAGAIDSLTFSAQDCMMEAIQYRTRLCASAGEIAHRGNRQRRRANPVTVMRTMRP